MEHFILKIELWARLTFMNFYVKNISLFVRARQNTAKM